MAEFGVHTGTAGTTADKAGLKNLAFLQEFLADQGITVPQAAELLGYTRHAILKWFRNDDAMLSVVQTLISKCGYSLNLGYEKPDSSVRVSIDSCKQGSADRRLGFLASALNSMGLSKVSASKLLGMCDSAVGYWIRKDDCAVSHLVDFAEKTGLVLNISLKKI